MFVQKDKKPRGLRIPATIATNVIKRIIWTLGFFKVVDVTITNKEVVPRKRAAILALNHTSILDPVVVLGALSRQAVAIGKAELWKSWTTGWLARLLGHIPVVRRDPVSGQAAYDSAKKVIQHGGIFVIFPEGTVVSPGDAKPYKPGVARLAMETGTMVIPVSLDGVNKVFPIKRDRTGKKAFFRKEKVTVTFGNPMFPKDYSSEDEFLAELRRRIEENLS